MFVNDCNVIKFEFNIYRISCSNLVGVGLKYIVAWILTQTKLLNTHYIAE